MRFSLLPFVAAIVSGCEYRIVPCSSDEQELFDASVSWALDNSAQIDEAMAENWTGARASMSDIIDALAAADVQCGIGVREGDGVAASHLDPGNRIVIDTSSVWFQDAFTMYSDHRWTVDFTLAELDDPTNPRIDRSLHPAPLNESLQYETSLGDISSVLLHEANHEVVGDHTPAAKDKIDQIEDEYGEDVEIQNLKDVDGIYALEWWTLMTSQDVWGDAMDTYVDSLSQ